MTTYRFHFSEYEDPNGRGRISVAGSYIYEADTQINRLKAIHSVPGKVVEIEGELNMRMFFSQELDALLKYNGFEIENKYGSSDETQFDRGSGTQLVVCQMME